MRKTTLKNSKQLLLEMKRQILREISEDLKHGREGAKDDGMDTYDLASEERDREINFILNDRERGSAVDRRGAGTYRGRSYGICESCEAEIARRVSRPCRSAGSA
jgi:RNA polymerase-binding transcription factor DksA